MLLCHTPVSSMRTSRECAKKQILRVHLLPSWHHCVRYLSTCTEGQREFERLTGKHQIVTHAVHHLKLLVASVLLPRWIKQCFGACSHTGMLTVANRCPGACMPSSTAVQFCSKIASAAWPCSVKLHYRQCWLLPYLCGCRWNSNTLCVKLQASPRGQLPSFCTSRHAAGP